MQKIPDTATPDQFLVQRSRAVGVQIGQILGLIGSFGLSAVAAAALMLNSIYDESFNPARLGVTLEALLVLHLLGRRRILLTREFSLYLALFGYMSLSLLWAPNAVLGMNTLLPALNFLRILMLFGSLAAFHDLRAVLLGMLYGFLFGATLYTLTEGFPLVRPQDFSYNAIAGMYLFGLFAVLTWGCYVRHGVLCLLVALVIMIHIAATTSIKTNLGVLLGAIAAAMIYFKNFAGVLRSYAIALVAVSAVIAYAIISNDALRETVQTGFARVSVGVEILSAREDVSSSTSFSERQDWKDVGLAGWKENPIFGSGVEAFRADYGITSHSTPIDLLYNFGLIGLVLFYGMFGTVVGRLFLIRRTQAGQLPVLVFAGLTCYIFMSLAATMHYNSFVAVFIAVSAALLRRQSAHAQRAT
jgi:O-antigen ligase